MITHERIREIISRNFSGYTEISVTADLRKRGAVWAFKGQTEISGLNTTFLIGIPKNFPLNKPIFFISPYDSIGFIPHIEPDGFICFIQDESLILDYSNPKGVLIECYKRTIDALEKGANKENKDDFLDEFEIYWSRNTNDSAKYYGLISGSSQPREIIVGINEGFRIITGNQRDLKLIKDRFKLRKPGRVIKGIYIPLKEGLITEPPRYNDFWNLNMIRSVVVESVDSMKLEKLLNGYDKKDEYIILGIPDNKGNWQLAGIRSRRKKTELKHPLLEIDTEYSLFPFVVERIDNQALVPRGGGDPSLSTKKVLIIGCGSLGGCIAMNLAKSGLGELTLCDPQSFKRENIHRHILGLSHLGMSKVEGLKEYIETERTKITEEMLNKSNIPAEIKSILLKNKRDSIQVSTKHIVYDENENEFENVYFNLHNQESLGTQKFFGLAGPIIDAVLHGTTLIIDEFSARLHPTLSKSILKIFNSEKNNPNNAQFVFATHSTSFLSGRIFRRDQIILFQKDRFGASKIKNLYDLRLRKDASFEKDYLLGKFESIPNINLSPQLTIPLFKEDQID